MTDLDSRRNGEIDVLDYLRVDNFLRSFLHARALRTAFELGLVEGFKKNKHFTFDELQQRCGSTREGLQLLMGLLAENQVVEKSDGKIRLMREFIGALRYQDLLIAKLEFAHLVTQDFTDLFTMLIQCPDRFVRSARIFDLFGYDRCLKYSPENYELTRRWMRFTTTLTKYEAQVCTRYHDFGRYRQMLDIGGNSGEFALRVCKKHPEIHAVVFDLPLVCDVGREHIGATPEVGRIEFIKGNAFVDALPQGFDLITFKSMLHDWPEQETQDLLKKAAKALAPGGTLLIFERGPLEIGEAMLPYSMLPFLLFFRSFRLPQVYEALLRQLGFENIEVKRVDLETPFFIITSTKSPR